MPRRYLLLPLMSLFGFGGAAAAAGEAKGKAFGAKSTAKQVQVALAPSLAGKTAIVTGANSGIGLETAKTLVSAGCRVIACTRNVDAGRAAIFKEMTSDGRGGYSVPLEDVERNVVVKQLDLASLSSVEAFVASLDPGPIDLLILNAGIMATPKLSFTPDGFEAQIGTNHFGHFHLTDLLYSRLVSQPDARVVTLASTAHTFGVVDTANLHFAAGRAYTPWGAYGQSKMANIMFAKGLAKKLEGDGHSIKSVSVHPGVIKTNLWRQTPFKSGRGSSVKLGVMGWLSDRAIMDKTVPQGAASTVWAALSPDVDQGGYISDCKAALPKVNQATDAKQIDELWRVTAEQIKQARARKGSPEL